MLRNRSIHGGRLYPVVIIVVVGCGLLVEEGRKEGRKEGVSIGESHVPSPPLLDQTSTKLTHGSCDESDVFLSNWFYLYCFECLDVCVCV